MQVAPQLVDGCFLGRRGGGDGLGVARAPVAHGRRFGHTRQPLADLVAQLFAVGGHLVEPLGQVVAQLLALGDDDVLLLGQLGRHLHPVLAKVVAGHGAPDELVEPAHRLVQDLAQLVAVAVEPSLGLAGARDQLGPQAVAHVGELLGDVAYRLAHVGLDGARVDRRGAASTTAAAGAEHGGCPRQLVEARLDARLELVEALGQHGVGVLAGTAGARGRHPLLQARQVVDDLPQRARQLVDAVGDVAQGRLGGDGLAPQLGDDPTLAGARRVAACSRGLGR